MPSTLRSGTAPRGNSPSNETSTVRVPFCTEGSMRTTLALDEPVAGVDLGPLADLNVARLRLGDLDFGLQAAGIGDAGEVGAWRDTRADRDLRRNHLQHAVDAGAHLELVALAAAELDDGPRLVDRRLLDGQLRARRIGAARQLFLGDLVADARAAGRRAATASTAAGK